MLKRGASVLVVFGSEGEVVVVKRTPPSRVRDDGEWVSSFGISEGKSIEKKKKWAYIYALCFCYFFTWAPHRCQLVGRESR